MSGHIPGNMTAGPKNEGWPAGKHRKHRSPIQTQQLETPVLRLLLKRPKMAPISLEDDSKDCLCSSSFLFSILVCFGSHLGCHVGSPKRSKFRASAGPVGVKTTKMDSCRPKTAHDAPKTTQEAAKTAQDANQEAAMPPRPSATWRESSKRVLCNAAVFPFPRFLAVLPGSFLL